MTDKTYAQKARQRRRTTAGRYEKMNECDLCGKPMGEDYFSDIRVDSDVTMPDGSIVEWGCYGLCLCAKCGNKLDKMSNLDAYEALTGEKYELHFDYRDPGGDFDTASRITPDPAGDDVTAEVEPVTGFMRPCERCNGTGTIDRGGTSPWRVVHCPDCSGTGIYDEVLIAARDGREYDAYVREQERMLNESLDYEETRPLDRYEPWGYEF